MDAVLCRLPSGLALPYHTSGVGGMLGPNETPASQHTSPRHRGGCAYMRTLRRRVWLAAHPIHCPASRAGAGTLMRASHAGATRRAARIHSPGDPRLSNRGKRVAHGWDVRPGAGEYGPCASDSTRDGSSAELGADGTYSNHTLTPAPAAHAWNVCTRRAESGTPE